MMEHASVFLAAAPGSDLPQPKHNREKRPVRGDTTAISRTWTQELSESDVGAHWSPPRRPPTGAPPTPCMQYRERGQSEAPCDWQ